MVWPDGDYALPMSVYGCPDTNVNKWNYGYMNISIKDNIELFETSIGQVLGNGPDWNLLELYGPYGLHSIQLNFCTKVNSGNEYNVAEWPSGQYGVYATQSPCPSG